MMQSGRAFHESGIAVLTVAMIVAAATPGASRAGECPVELSELAHWNQDSGSYGDIWADGNIAYVGQYFDNKVHFFDISNPANPVRFVEWSVPSPNTGASAQDVKTGDGLLFIALESNGGDGVEIVDVRDPFNPTHLTWVTTPAHDDVHNLFYDGGYLYLASSRSPAQVAVVDLTSYNPDAPPPAITQNRWLIDVGIGPFNFVHDITVVDDRLYACAWDAGLHVYDVSNIANEPPVLLGSAEGNSTHAVWPSDDGRWAVVGEEREGGPTKLYELTPNGNGLDVVLRDTLMLDLGVSFSSHNPVVVGTRAYVSWYQAGVVILDINEQTKSLDMVSSYDTYQGGGGGFDGAWGVYPFLGEDTILVSDLSNGFFVVSATPSVDVGYPEGLVEFVHPIDGSELTVSVSSECVEADPDSVRLLVQVDEEDSFDEIPMAPVGGGVFEGTIPAAPCGSVVSYYVQFDSLEGETFVDPPGAPGSPYVAGVASNVEVLFADDFEQDSGWTAEFDECDTDQTGFWERADPVGTSTAPENDFGDGTLCYITENGEPGESAGTADVDGGPFLLTSPTVATDGQDAVIRYARWFAQNTAGDEDFLEVELSTDGGDTWQTLEVVGDSGTQWIEREYQLSDVTEPGASVTLRFFVQDCPNNTITEAAIDDVSVTIIECIDSDVVAPFIVHDGASTYPFTGYIDPRRESTNGETQNDGITDVTVTFSEPVRNVGGAPLDATAFFVTSTGGIAPAVAAVDASDNPTVVLSLEGPIPAGSWTTIIADVEDNAANLIDTDGNMGAGVAEPDRVDIGFLPGDVDQNGLVQALDVLRFRQILSGVFVPPIGAAEDYVDTDRNGMIEPVDLLGFRQLLFGTGDATQPWAEEMIDADQP